MGDWGWGIGDWELAQTPNPQSPIPNPQSPNTKNILDKKYLLIYLILSKGYFDYI